MFEHILVPVDLSEGSLEALERIDALISRRDISREGVSRVTLLHVIETIEDASFEELRAFYERLEAKARRQLQVWVTELLADGVEARQQVVYGRRAEEILRYAGEEEADLIVLSSHRVDPENPGLGWGTISYQVAILAACPVLLVK